MISPDDKAALDKIRSGETSAYAEIIRRYQPRILQLCLSMLSDEKEAEDAAQEIFIKAFYALGKFHEKSSLYTWLYRIAANHCLDLGRKKARQKTHSLEEMMEKSGTDFESNHMSTQQPPKPEFQELVEWGLSRVTSEERLVLVLREIQGLSYEEMTVTLACSLDAVKGRLKRARQSLKEKMRHVLGTESV